MVILLLNQEVVGTREDSRILRKDATSSNSSLGVYTILHDLNLKFKLHRDCRVISLTYFLLNHADLKVFRKEVIHPQLRLRIPCYDLSFIADLYLVRKMRPSIATDFAALTGGVYLSLIHI